ncbi:hypothetical protein [Streptomyces venetus]|uniref:hypothetical protein n=1 Tax=Streptomyces venetus TaxID=1701086 RepID=UPI003C2DB0E2
MEVPTCVPPARSVTWSQQIPDWSAKGSRLPTTFPVARFADDAEKLVRGPYPP